MSSILNIRTFLASEGKRTIEDCVAKVELNTSAEIKVCIVQNSNLFGFMPRLRKKDKERDVLRRAKKEYGKLGIGNTRDATGILIMISLEEKMVRVLCGSAINEKLPPVVWSKMVSIIISGIDSRAEDKGICRAINSISDMLARHFPAKSDDTNEIPNHVIIKR